MESTHGEQLERSQTSILPSRRTQSQHGDAKTLKGSKTLVIRDYGQNTGADASEADRLISGAAWWSQNGFKVEMVLRYTPTSGKAGGWLAWLQNVVQRLATIPSLVRIQIGNEPNKSRGTAYTQ